jgi:hypothetical protein
MTNTVKQYELQLGSFTDDSRMEPWLQKRGWKVLGYDDQALTDCVISIARMKSRGGK